MKRILMMFAVLAFVLSAAPAWAQGADQNDHLAWDQAAPNQAEAQAYTYRKYDDGATTGVTISGVTCEATATAGSFLCYTLLGAYTSGSHSVTVSAALPDGSSESLPSTPLVFSFIVAPNAPTGLRIIRR